MSKIGDRIRAALPEGRGEQKALAHRAGVTPEALNKILTGATKEPGFETIARVARAAGLDLNAIADESAELPQLPSLTADLLTPADRRRIAEFVTWVAQRFGIHPYDGDENQPTSPPRDQAAIDAQRLVATVERMDDDAKKKFFETLASQDLYETLKLYRPVPRGE